MSDEPTLAHRVQYALFVTAAAVGQRVSESMADRFGEAAGRLAYRPLGIRRRIVEQHIRLAFPDRAEAWVRGTASGCYAHLGREAIAMLRMASMTREQIIERTHIDGLEDLRDGLAAGRGVVIVAGHLGNWEIGAAMLAARGLPIDVVAQRQANPLFDRRIVAARERMGLRVIDRGRAPKLALRSLRGGRIVAFVSDQNAGPGGVFVPFFGRPASTHRGGALMAIRTGAPLVLAVPLRIANGHYHMRLSRIDVDRSGDPDAAVARLTVAFTAALEKAVSAAPDQYLWHHRRWKTRPPEERITSDAV